MTNNALAFANHPPVRMVWISLPSAGAIFWHLFLGIEPAVSQTITSLPTSTSLLPSSDSPLPLIELPKTTVIPSAPHLITQGELSERTDKLKKGNEVTFVS